MENRRGVFLPIAVALIIAVGVFWWINRPINPEQMRNVDMLSTEQETTQITEQSDVEYYGEAKGFYAAPTEPGSYPGIVMVHEWWGLNDYIKDMARELAKQGYQVLAVDMYSGEVATVSARAGELAGGVRGNVEEANKNLQAAADYLREQKVSKVASLGWCFGGGQSLNLALSGEDLDATVIYYGNLTSDKTQLEKIDWPVLGVFGEADQSIPVQSARDFDAALDELKIDNEIYIYPGVGHAFANPSGMNYAANETKDAWAKTLAFLEKHLK